MRSKVFRRVALLLGLSYVSAFVSFGAARVIQELPYIHVFYGLWDTFVNFGHSAGSYALFGSLAFVVVVCISCLKNPPFSIVWTTICGLTMSALVPFLISEVPDFVPGIPIDGPMSLKLFILYGAACYHLEYFGGAGILGTVGAILLLSYICLRKPMSANSSGSVARSLSGVTETVPDMDSPDEYAPPFTLLSKIPEAEVIKTSTEKVGHDINVDSPERHSLETT